MVTIQAPHSHYYGKVAQVCLGTQHHVDLRLLAQYTRTIQRAELPPQQGGIGQHFLFQDTEVACICEPVRETSRPLSQWMMCCACEKQLCAGVQTWKG